MTKQQFIFVPIIMTNKSERDDLRLSKMKNDPCGYWVVYQRRRIGQVTAIGRFNDWAWSLNKEKVDTTSTYGIYGCMEDAARKVYVQYLRRIIKQSKQEYKELLNA